MRREVDAEFAEYVSAREQQLLRAAFLVGGDARHAEDVLQQALTTLAPHWEKVRSEDPDLVVRRVLYRDATTVRREGGRQRGAGNPPERALGQGTAGPGAAGEATAGQGAAGQGAGVVRHVSDRDRLRLALRHLTGRQRAVVVLRWLERRSEAETADVLGVSVGAVSHAAQSSLGELRDLLGSAGTEDGRTGADQRARRLGALLEEASDHLPAVDLADVAWSEAVRRRDRRRRRVCGGVAALAVMAALAAGTAHTTQDAPDRVAPVPGPTPTRSAVLRDRALDGTAYVIAPVPGIDTGLTQLRTDLPRLLDPAAPSARLSDLQDGSDGGPPQRASFAFVRAIGGQAYRPVVVDPLGRHVDIDRLTLRPVAAGPSGAPSVPFSAAALSGGGTRLVFPQPSEVVVVDLPLARITRVRLGEPHLAHAGWTLASTGVVASSATRSWYIDGQSLKPTALPGPSYPGHYEVVADGGSGPRMLVRDAYGNASAGDIPFVAPITRGAGETMGNAEGWAARAVHLDSRLLDVRPQSDVQGVVAVPAAQPASRRLLVRAGPGPATAECCAVLGWRGPQQVLYLDRGREAGRSWVLAWDVVTGEVRRVTEVLGQVPLAVGPG